MNDQAQAPVQTEEHPDVIQNLDQFAFLLANWFSKNRAQLQHMLNIPDGQSLTVQLEVNEPEEDVILTGDVLKGFKVGMIVASNIFGSLPFGRAEDTSASEAPVAESNAAPAQ